MRIRVLSSITEISTHQWDGLWPNAYPFTRHDFFSALESSGSIDSKTRNNTGWRTAHIVVYDSPDNPKGGQAETSVTPPIENAMETPVAVMPLFIKMHSYGEYVFDWSWASAYQQAGIEYYPKLVNAVPFTPATGPRIAFSASLSEENKSAYCEAIMHRIKQITEEIDASGFHCLFPDTHTAKLLASAGYSQRLGTQFHWFNNNYNDFDDFLSTFSSRKRKNIRKERAKARQNQKPKHSTDITIRKESENLSFDFDIKMRNGTEVSADEWKTFSALYNRTYLKRSGHSGYLGHNFFQLIAGAIPDQVLLASAHQGQEMISAALYFRDEDVLYGRYWGTKIDIDGLHFECCYYQGIEYAIKHKLKRFDPGAQGEHKIQRGFTPIKTQSFHWLRQPEFNQAVGNFVRQEAPEISRYITKTRELLPFKEGRTIPDEDILL